MPIFFHTVIFISRTKLIHHPSNRFTHSGKIALNLPICKAEQVNTILSQEGCPLCIVKPTFFIKVPASINLDSKTQTCRIEIHNIFSNRLLAAKVLRMF